MDVDEAALAAEVERRFPPGTIRQVRVRPRGAAGAFPELDGGQGLAAADECELWLVPAAAGPGRPRRDWLLDFRRQHGETIERLVEDLPKLTGGRCRWVRIADRQQVLVFENSSLRKGGPVEHRPGGEGGIEWGQTPVMSRLGAVDLETLDTLVAAGYAASRADAVRWALARIRERPAYQEIRRHVMELDRLKTDL